MQCFGLRMTLALLTIKTHHNNTKDDGKWRRTKK
jgi:hypothetical protein